MSREILFWDKEYPERLGYKTEDEAIESLLGAFDELPKTLKICGFAPVNLLSPIILESFAESVLRYLLDNLDDDYGDCRSSDATDAMKEAAKVFARAVLSEYKLHVCGIVERKTINVAEWVGKNRPNWPEKEESCET